MVKKGKHVIKSYMTLSYDFTGMRIQDSFLTPVDWALSVNLVASIKKNKSKEETENSASIAYQKLYFWLDTNLQNIVAVDVGKEDDLYLANLSANIMMYCPGNPGDDLIIQLLHSKLSALAGTALEVCDISLRGSDTSLKYTFDCEDEVYNLPLTTEEYYTEGKARDTDPWWTRDDGFCFEFIRPEEVAVSDEEFFKDISDPLDEFHRIISEVTEAGGTVREPARIVQVEKWKPKKV